MKPLLVAVLSATALLAGCATKQPQMSRDEYLKTTQRTYEGKSADDVLNAAEKLFRLADGDDFTFFHDDNSMGATRRWSVYLVLAATMGTDTWTVRVKDLPGAIRVSAALNTSAGSILPMPTTGGDMSAGTTPGMGGNVPGTAIYDVFWARMDYLLGKSDQWMTCEESNRRVSTGAVWGSNEALCNGFNVKDDLPSELVGRVEKPKPSSTYID
ncbi:hypothetical protein ACXIUT_27785 [Achromobacter denitrificans]